MRKRKEAQTTIELWHIMAVLRGTLGPRATNYGTGPFIAGVLRNYRGGHESLRAFPKQGASGCSEPSCGIVALREMRLWPNGMEAICPPGKKSFKSECVVAILNAQPMGDYVTDAFV